MFITVGTPKMPVEKKKKRGQHNRTEDRAFALLLNPVSLTYYLIPSSPPGVIPECRIRNYLCAQLDVA